MATLLRALRLDLQTTVGGVDIHVRVDHGHIDVDIAPAERPALAVVPRPGGAA